MLFQSISKALPCTLMHCISDSTCYATLHCPLHLCLCTCCPHLFVCLPLSLVHMLLACLFVSPSRLFLLIDGQWTSAKSDCTHSVRACLRLGTYYVLVLMELQQICGTGTQGDGSLLNAVSRKCYMRVLQCVHRGTLP